MPVRQRPQKESLNEQAIRQRIERGAGEPTSAQAARGPERRVGVLLKIPESLKGRLDAHLKSLPIKRASWILMAIHEKLERDEREL